MHLYTDEVEPRTASHHSHLVSLLLEISNSYTIVIIMRAAIVALAWATFFASKAVFGGCFINHICCRKLIK